MTVRRRIKILLLLFVMKQSALCMNLYLMGVSAGSIHSASPSTNKTLPVFSIDTSLKRQNLQVKLVSFIPLIMGGDDFSTSILFTHTCS